MAVTTFTWVNGVSGDWNVAADWNPGTVPATASALALIQAVPAAGGTYSVTIASGESFTAAGVTLNNAGATLDVAGTLTLSPLNGGALNATHGEIVLSSGGTIADATSLTGLLTGNGNLVSNSETLANNGTIDANTANGSLFILQSLANNGVIEASGPGGAFIGIEGTTFANFSANTLTGGTYIAQGTGSQFNQIGFAVGNNSVITTDAANIVFDGPATNILGFNGAAFESISGELQTIASTGTLQLLNSRSLTFANPLTDAGRIVLGAGSLTDSNLTIAAGGTLSGSGTVNAAIANSGLISASGGTLNLGSASITGTGALGVAANSALVLSGGAASSIANDGTVFVASGVLSAGTLSGTGTLVIVNGATGDITGAASQTISFGGANATLRLENPTQYTGSLVGFGAADQIFQGDTLVLGGLKGDGASIANGNTLVVTSGGTPIDSIMLSGDYHNTTFSAATLGNDTQVLMTSGAVTRDTMPISIASFADQAGLGSADEALIQNTLSAAAADWGQYVTGFAPLRLSLTLANTAPGARIAQAGPIFTSSDGVTLSETSLVALNTGNYLTGQAIDINVTLYAGGTNIASLFLGPTLGQPTLPANLIDLRSVFRHELAHGLAWFGLYQDNPDGTTQAFSAPFQSTYDQNVQATVNNGTVTAANFTGPHAEAEYAALIASPSLVPVPLTVTNQGENIYHFGNLNTDPLAHDLMTGVGISPGATVAISAMDLAVMRDVGLPVTAGLVCFARGTRIATPDGEIPVETLAPGDLVVTEAGEAMTVRWIGRRRLDCRRHPEPSVVRPVRISAHAFGPDLPSRDLYVSPGHAIGFRNVLIPAWLLINGRNVTQPGAGVVEYFHIELDRHEILLAEGLPAESYLDAGDRHQFDNGGTRLALYPDFAARAWECAAAAPLVQTGRLLEAARRHLRRTEDDAGSSRWTPAAASA